MGLGGAAAASDLGMGAGEGICAGAVEGVEIVNTPDLPSSSGADGTATATPPTADTAGALAGGESAVASPLAAVFLLAFHPPHLYMRNSPPQMRKAPAAAPPAMPPIAPEERDDELEDSEDGAEGDSGEVFSESPGPAVVAATEACATVAAGPCPATSVPVMVMADTTSAVTVESAGTVVAAIRPSRTLTQCSEADE